MQKSELLYKVTKPRDDWTFQPQRFWITEDWSFSSEYERTDLREESVLYVGSFEEVNIHLLPKVWRLRVWLDSDERCARLKNLGFSWAGGSQALIFALEADRNLIESFSPTIFTFDRAGFEQIPTNEFVSREPRTALSAETMPFADVLRRWQFDVIYVTDADALVKTLRSARIDHQIQT